MSDHLYTIQGHACPHCGAPVAMAGDDWVSCAAGCGYHRVAGDEDGRQEEQAAYVDGMRCEGCE
jgi:hypothetical protein